MASLMPVAKQQFFVPGTAIPLVGGNLYTYAAGTSTPKTTWQDAAGATPNTNPITLDSTGSALIFWSGNYKIVLKDSLGNTVYTVDNYNTDQASALQTQLAASAGSSMVGFAQSGVGAVARSAQDELRERVSVTQFGAVGDGVTSDAYAFQKAMLYAYSIGGARVHIPTPKVAWLLDYPVFVRDNTEVVGTGVSCRIIFKNPTDAKGRGGFVIGSSLEANRDLALAAYANGTYPGATTVSNAYVNPTLKQYLRDNPGKAEAKNASIHDVYLVAQFDSPTGWGGYGINIVNAWNCHAWNIWGEGWTQLIGMGSDVSPETPSNYACSATNLHVIKPDLVHTYYAIGFIANSTNCEISKARMYAAIPDGTPDGNGVATNFVEDCTIHDIVIPSLGQTQNSQGVLLNNSKGCIADQIYVRNAKTAVATFYTDGSFNDPAKRNKLGPTIVGEGCTYVLNIGAKYASFLGYINANSAYDVGFLNSNATNNNVSGPNNAIYTPTDQARRLYFANNSLQNWNQRDIYFRPMELLVNDKVDTSSYDLQKNVKAKAATTLNFLWRVPEYVRAIDATAFYVTYADNAQAAGTKVIAQIRRMVGFNGNSSEAPYIEASVTDTATNTVTTDKFVQLPSAFIETQNTANGLANSMDLLISFQLPTQFSTMKEIKITYFGS